MNKPEIGMYVKFKTLSNQIKIGQIKEIDGSIYDLDNDVTADKYVIGKPSFDIIDLIKPKDIILGKDGKLYQCWKIFKGYVFTYSKNKYGDTITLVDYQIDRVLTKEQFESMSYRIGE